MKYLSYFFVICSLLVVFSCSKKEPANIEVSLQDINLANDNSSSQFVITSNVDWIISLSDLTAGFRVSPMQGKAGETSVTVVAVPNMTDKQLSSDLIIKGGGVEKKISLSQISVKFKVSETDMLFAQEADTKSFTIESNTKWSIDAASLPEWIESITPTSGESDATVTVKTKFTDVRKVQELPLRISYGSFIATVKLKKTSAYNCPPTQPEIQSITSISNNADGKSTIPVIKWSASTDDEKDKMYYYVEYSTDGTKWFTLPKTDATELSFIKNRVVLEPNTTYKIRVVADDEFNEGRVPSKEQEFTTGDVDCYKDGGTRLYKQGKESKTVKLVFMGDAYLPEDFVYGKGKFDTDLDEAVKGLFSVEPYKTYEEYFSVYVVATYSNETGISSKVNGKRENKDTFFKCTLTGGTGIECSNEKVFNYACKVDGIDKSNLTDVAISIIINADVYAGTCYTISDGRSIAMTPVLRKNATSTVGFVNVLLHEFGGHGFGRLADEYVNGGNESATIPADKKTELEQWQKYGYNMNVTAKLKVEDAPWAKFKNQGEKYSKVDMYPGGYYYGRGVFKPEVTSCMVKNFKYYNAQSRFLIYERIMKIVKKKVDFDEFLRNDKIENVPTESAVKASAFEDLPPLAPPIRIIAE